MKHQTLDQLQTIAEVHPDRAQAPMGRNERLERWAELLERDPARRLSTLPGTEYRPADARVSMRSAGSPISVAFDDPKLRAEGLSDDSYGEAKRFFELTDGQMHDIVCYCHHGATITAGAAAKIVRAAMNEAGAVGLLARMRAAFTPLTRD